MVRRADAERESAGARDLGGQRLLRHDQRMAGLDGDDRCSDLNAFGGLAEKRDRGHGVEVAGNLGNPERRETLAFRSLSVGQQTAQPVRT